MGEGNNSTIVGLVKSSMFRSFRVPAVFLVAAAGCATHYLPNTDVEDSSENRRIIAFCEKYRRAVEARDVTTLLQMASPKYFEDGGNLDATDDIDHAGLKDYLLGQFQDARAVRYEVRYRNVTLDEKADTLQVDFTYSASFRIPIGGTEAWRREVRDNRLSMVRDGEGYLIVSGM